MQKRRLFIAIPLSESAARSVKKIVNELERKFEHFSDTKIRFMPRENWHITVSFLGSQNDIMLPAITSAIKKVSYAFEPPEIVFEKIDYGPLSPKRSDDSISPRSKEAKMIWLHTDQATSESIGKIKGALEDELAMHAVPFQREARTFSGHITLARFPEGHQQATLPNIEKTLQFSFSAPSIDLMESNLVKSGAEYNILQVTPFKE